MDGLDFVSSLGRPRPRASRGRPAYVQHYGATPYGEEQNDDGGDNGRKWLSRAIQVGSLLATFL